MLLQHARILLIDDEEVDFVLTRKLLDQADAKGLELQWAATFDEGLAILERESCDACLLDYRLGERDGLDLLREVARRGISVPIILLTGVGNDQIDRNALELGAAGFLDKTRLDARELLRALRYALRREGVVTELVDHNNELLLLHRLTRLLLGEKADFDRAAAQISLTFDQGMVAIERYLPAQESLVTLGSYGLEHQAGERIRVEDHPARGVLQSGTPLLAMPPAGVPAAPFEEARTLAYVPMRPAAEENEERVGILTLGFPTALALDSSAIHRLATVANHLGELIEHRQSAGRVAAEPQGTPPLRTGEILEAVYQWFTRRAAGPNQVLRLEGSANVPGHPVDPDALRRLLSALLQLAADVGTEGEVLLRFTPKEQLHLELPIAGLDARAQAALGSIEEHFAATEIAWSTSASRLRIQADLPVLVQRPV